MGAATGSSPQPAATPQARTRTEAEISRNIGNPILLDKIAGLSKGLIGMKVFAVVLALSPVLSASPSFAQAQPAAPAPAAQAPAPATQKPAQPPPPATQKPGQPAAAQPPAPRVPFQTGLKYAYVDLQEVAQTSTQGKAFNGKVQGLQEQKLKELQDKNKQLQAAQDKLEKGASVLSDAARAGLQGEIEK